MATNITSDETNLATNPSRRASNSFRNEHWRPTQLIITITTPSCVSHREDQFSSFVYCTAPRWRPPANGLQNAREPVNNALITLPCAPIRIPYHVFPLSFIRLILFLVLILILIVSHPLSQPGPRTGLGSIPFCPVLCRSRPFVLSSCAVI
jgi:hypothetical protein